MSCVNSNFLYHSHLTSLGVCKCFVLEYHQLKSETRFEMLSGSVLDPLNCVSMRPMCTNITEESCRLFSFSLETSSLFGFSGLVVAVQDR